MGMRVVAVDVGDSKLKYCKSLGAEFTVDAMNPEAVSEVKSNRHSVHVRVNYACVMSRQTSYFLLSHV
jgi:D-arabinose 1-dehydrogenase-like Zn-dependent alcohol dehydrogenase